MKRLLSRRWFKISAGLALVLLGALVASAWYFRIWSWRDLQVYRAMSLSDEYHPVWKDLHWGRIHSGQDVEEVIAATNPVRVEHYGKFVQLNYQEGLRYSGVTIIAKDGQLLSASAWSCTGSQRYFDNMTPNDWEAYIEASRNPPSRCVEHGQ